MNEHSNSAVSRQHSKNISIPSGYHDRLLMEMPISTRLKNVLTKMGCERLGDLRRLSFDTILESSDFDQKTITELESFINRLHSGGLPAPETDTQQPVRRECLDLEIDCLELSPRAHNCLKKVGVRTVGELVQKGQIELLKYEGFGPTILKEVKDALAPMGLRLRVSSRTQPSKEAKPPEPERILIPQEARDWPLSKMPLSTRLAGVLDRMGFWRLGNMHGVTFEEVEKTDHCGRRTIAELESFVLRLQSGEVGCGQSLQEQSIPAGLVRLIDEAVEKISPRKRGMLILRFGGEGGEARSLEEVGNSYDLTRQGVKQVLDKVLEDIHKFGWPSVDELLRTLSERCLNLVCPLTPQLLAQWLGPDVSTCRYGLPFYIRLFNEIFPEFPGWPDGQRTILYNSNRRARRIILHLKETICGKIAPVSLAEAFDGLKDVDELRELKAGELLSILKKEPSIKVDFTTPDKPHIKQLSLNVRYLASSVLSQSDRPLTSEEIIEKAVETRGEDFSPPAAFILEYALRSQDGFYLLDRRAFGLRRHFRLPDSLWGKVKEDIYNLLKEEKRPISSSEIINESRFDWTALTNSYEVAEVLREDARFTDLGRFLFALSEWGVEERQHINDLMTRVLEQAGHPMTHSEILTELNRFRSVVGPSISPMIRANKEVRDYGSGFYGLKRWGEEVKEFLVSEPRMATRILERADRPLTFGEMCQILEVPSEGPLAGKLWNTVRSLPEVKMRYGIRRAETMLMHWNWDLRRALHVTLARAMRPMSALEIQREMNDRFGIAFKDQSLSDIQKCLRQSRSFIRSNSGEYSLRGVWRRGGESFGSGGDPT